MRSIFGNPEIIATEIGGQFRPGVDEIVRPLFGPVAKVVWHHDTEAFIATIGECDVRTARRWMRGEFDAPAIVYNEMFGRIIRSGRLVRK